MADLEKIVKIKMGGDVEYQLKDMDAIHSADPSKNIEIELGDSVTPNDNKYVIEFTEDDDSVATSVLTLDSNGVLRMTNMAVASDEVETVVSKVAELEVEVRKNSLKSEVLELQMAKTYTYTVDVPVNWAEDTVNGGYVQTIAVTGILENDNPIWDLVLGTDSAINDSHQEAYALIDRLTTANGFITLWANADAPTVAITIQLKVVR